MGADLLVAALVIDKDKTPDIGAGREWVRTAPFELLTRAYDDEHGDVYDPYAEDATGQYGDDEEYAFVDEDGEYTQRGQEELRKYVLGRLEKFDEEILSPSRFTAVMTVRGAHIYLSAGLSYGDPPTDEAALMWEIERYEGLLEAMGFEV